MEARPRHWFDPLDHNFLRLRGRLSPGERLMAMLAAREWVVSAIRGRLQRRYPDLSPEEINLKVLEEIERAERREGRPQSLSAGSRSRLRSSADEGKIALNAFLREMVGSLDDPG